MQIHNLKTKVHFCKFSQHSEETITNHGSYIHQYCQIFNDRSHSSLLKAPTSVGTSAESQVMIWLALAWITSTPFPTDKELNPLFKPKPMTKSIPKSHLWVSISWGHYLVPISISYRCSQETETTLAIWIENNNSNNNNVSNY